MTEQRRRQYPELKPGIRIQCWDGSGAVRTEYIYSRKGNILTVINVLKEKTRIRIDQVQGYWEPRVKASPKNFHPLREKNRLFSGL